jgi:transcriptional regulator, arsr family
MEIKRLSTILKLIANPERMAILFLLLDGDRSITELAQALDSSPTGIANHLARLRTEGIIEYRLISEEAATILNTLRTLKDQAE